MQISISNGACELLPIELASKKDQNLFTIASIRKPEPDLNLSKALEQYYCTPVLPGSAEEPESPQGLFQNAAKPAETDWMQELHIFEHNICQLCFHIGVEIDKFASAKKWIKKLRKYTTIQRRELAPLVEQNARLTWDLDNYKRINAALQIRRTIEKLTFEVGNARDLQRVEKSSEMVVLPQKPLNLKSSDQNIGSWKFKKGKKRKNARNNNSMEVPVAQCPTCIDILRKTGRPDTTTFLWTSFWNETWIDARTTNTTPSISYTKRIKVSLS